MAAILVTGAAKGIGHACVARLARAGHHVYTGVRKTTDGNTLRTTIDGRITPVLLDVTKPEQIAAAAEHIHETIGGERFAGVVNNAGIAIAGPLEFLPVDELRRQLEVNVIGQVAVTQAMLPLLRASRGRIVNIGSIAGRSALPFMGPYSASKFALEAITDALRVELMGWSIHVAIIEPGVIATPIWETSVKAATGTMERMPAEVFEYYGPVLTALQKRALNGTTGGLPPDAVAHVVEQALFARKPKTRYVVGRNARLRLLLENLPDRVRDRLIQRGLRKL